MRAWIYTVAVPLLAVVALAQDTPPAKKGTKTADTLQEMKTQTYSGTLLDASCATTSNSADRAAGSGAPQSCSVSTGTSHFALKTKDGNTVKFDDVGNTRVQEAIKSHKKWSDTTKPIHVKASGVLNGDKLTVLSID